MNTYLSTKPDTVHLFCPDPIMPDKSRQWGENNIQRHDYGCFLQMTEDGQVAHCVAKNEGWLNAI